MDEKILIGLFVFLVVISLMFGLYEQPGTLVVYECSIDSDCSKINDWVQVQLQDNTKEVK